MQYEAVRDAVAMKVDKDVVDRSSPFDMELTVPGLEAQCNAMELILDKKLKESLCVHFRMRTPTRQSQRRRGCGGAEKIRLRRRPAPSPPPI
jgi:hypothetical protein